MENKKISEIKGYKKNPRKITEKMFNLLGETIKEFGDLSGIVVNVNTGEVIGGNQRTNFFKQNANECEIKIVERFKTATPQGTVATGYVDYNGEKFAYREVDWDTKKSDRANIVANKVGGFWDNDMLANEFDIEDLKFGGFEEFELGFFNDEIEKEDFSNEVSISGLNSSEENVIKLIYNDTDYFEILQKMNDLKNSNGLSSNEEVLKFLLR